MASRRCALTSGDPGSPTAATDWRPASTGRARDRTRRRPSTEPAGQDRGAWDAAHARALRATLALLDIADPRPGGPHELAWWPPTFAVGASCTEPPNDAGLRPFVGGTGELLQRVADGLPRGLAGGTQRFACVNHDAHARTTLRVDRSWTALLHRDGAAGVAYGCPGNEASIHALGGPDGPLRMAWTAAVDLLAGRVDGSGSARLSVLVNGDLPCFKEQPVFYVDRAIELVPPSIEEVESVVREIELATADSVVPDSPPS